MSEYPSHATLGAICSTGMFVSPARSPARKFLATTALYYRLATNHFRSSNNNGEPDTSIVSIATTPLGSGTETSLRSMLDAFDAL